MIVLVFFAVIFLFAFLDKAAKEAKAKAAQPPMRTYESYGFASPPWPETSTSPSEKLHS